MSVVDDRREAALGRLDRKLGKIAGGARPWIPPWKAGLALMTCPREPKHGRVVAITVNDAGMCGACLARFTNRGDDRPGFRVPAEPKPEMALF